MELTYKEPFYWGITVRKRVILWDLQPFAADTLIMPNKKTSISSAANVKRMGPETCYSL